MNFCHKIDDKNNCDIAGQYAHDNYDFCLGETSDKCAQKQLSDSDNKYATQHLILMLATKKQGNAILFCPTVVSSGWSGTDVDITYTIPNGANYNKCIWYCTSGYNTGNGECEKLTYSTKYTKSQSFDAANYSNLSSQYNAGTAIQSIILNCSDTRDHCYDNYCARHSVIALISQSTAQAISVTTGADGGKGNEPSSWIKRIGISKNTASSTQHPTVKLCPPGYNVTDTNLCQVPSRNKCNATQKPTNITTWTDAGDTHAQFKNANFDCVTDRENNDTFEGMFTLYNISNMRCAPGYYGNVTQITFRPRTNKYSITGTCTPCELPTWAGGNMTGLEWIDNPDSPNKTAQESCILKSTEIQKTDNACPSGTKEFNNICHRVFTDSTNNQFIIPVNANTTCPM